jgi:hypothetical protein
MIRAPDVTGALFFGTALGEYLERGEAMRRVEGQIETNMSLVLHDWGLYQTVKAQRDCV